MHGSHEELCQPGHCQKGQNAGSQVPSSVLLAIADRTLLEAIADLERACEDCGYYCEPPEDNPQLDEARERRRIARAKLAQWITANAGLHRTSEAQHNEKG